MNLQKWEKSLQEALKEDPSRAERALHIVSYNLIAYRKQVEQKTHTTQTMAVEAALMLPSQTGKTKLNVENQSHRSWARMVVYGQKLKGATGLCKMEKRLVEFVNQADTKHKEESERHYKILKNT